MLHISLSLDDALVLREVIESSLVDLRREIWHTDSHEFRDVLKRRCEALERALDELALVTAPEP
jgi:hypothetical protein